MNAFGGREVIFLPFHLSCKRKRKKNVNNLKKLACSEERLTQGDGRVA